MTLLRRETPDSTGSTASITIVCHRCTLCEGTLDHVTEPPVYRSKGTATVGTPVRASVVRGPDAVHRTGLGR